MRSGLYHCWIEASPQIAIIIMLRRPKMNWNKDRKMILINVRQHGNKRNTKTVSRLDCGNYTDKFEWHENILILFSFLDIITVGLFFRWVL